MPSIQFYHTAEDFCRITSWLSSEEPLALIKPDGEGCWKAFKEFVIEENGRHCLYHSDSGPLPLLAEEGGGADSIISDPFEGWAEKRTSRNKLTPYFGAGHTGIIWFNSGVNPNYSLNYSSFEWIGNHYSILAQKAPDVAQKWWNRLRRFVIKNAVKINHNGELVSRKSPYWATKLAAEKIKMGAFEDIIHMREQERLARLKIRNQVRAQDKP